MKETEVKIIDENFDRIRLELIGLDAEKTFEGQLWTRYLDTEEMKFTKSGKVLRLRGRDNAEGAVLTFKSIISDDRISVYDEKEVWVEDAETILKILKAVGFVVTDEIIKNRQTFQLNDAEIVFDKLHGRYEFVPEYMEIEGADKQTVEKYIKTLKIKKQNVKALNSHEIIDYFEHLVLRPSDK